MNFATVRLLTWTTYDVCLCACPQDPSPTCQRVPACIRTTSSTTMRSGTRNGIRTFGGATWVTRRTGSRSTNLAPFTACRLYRLRKARAPSCNIVAMMRKEDYWPAAPVPARRTSSARTSRNCCTTGSTCCLGGFATVTSPGTHSRATATGHSRLAYTDSQPKNKILSTK